MAEQRSSGAFSAGTEFEAPNGAQFSSPKRPDSLRIIHLANHCSRGHGNAHVAVDLACVQARNGHTVAYASAGGTYVDLLKRHGVEHVDLKQNRKDPVSATMAAVRMAQLCSRFRPDVLHAHMMPGAVLGRIVSRLMNIPLVNTVHNSFDVTSYVMRFGDRIVAVSRAEQQQLLRRGFPADRVDLVVNGPNGTPREDEHRHEPVPEIRQPAVVTVCGLHRRKGVDILIQAFARAALSLPDWNLYVAGWGPDYKMLVELKDELQDELGLGERIHLLGFVANTKHLLPRCDIFALASLAEPFGLVLSEARAAGCAMIGSAVGGIPEALEYGRAGTLVTPGNIDELANALHTLMSNPELLARAKATALENSEQFNIERVVVEYDAVYRRVQVATVRHSMATVQG